MGRGQNTARALLTWAMGPEGVPFFFLILTKATHGLTVAEPPGPLGILTAPNVLATHTAGPLSHMPPCLVTQLVPMTKRVISITPPARQALASFSSFLSKL